jgi:hypothetical protein
MTFAAGVPLLVPLCAIALIGLYRMDRYLFCRSYKQPGKMSTSLLEWVLRVLPWAAVVRLAVSVFILSSGIVNNSFPAMAGSDTSAQGYSANAVSLDNYNNQIAILQSQHYLPEYLRFLEERVFQANTLPLVILIIVILVVKLLRRVWNFLPPVMLAKIVWRFIKMLLGHNSFRASKTPGTK